jgi:hypothetical protein
LAGTPTLVNIVNVVARVAEFISTDAEFRALPIKGRN